MKLVHRLNPKSTARQSLHERLDSPRAEARQVVVPLSRLAVGLKPIQRRASGDALGGQTASFRRVTERYVAA